MTTIIEIELDDGTTVKGAADFGKGSPTNPMSDRELADKFHQCAAWGGLRPDQAQAVLDAVWKIEQLDDVNVLTRMLQTRRVA
jgi:2-methylcitrate dehydratase PrpD